jgi:hypothetical protein
MATGQASLAGFEEALSDDVESGCDGCDVRGLGQCLALPG